MKATTKYELCINVDIKKFRELQKYMMMVNITDYFWLNVFHKEDEYVNVSVKIYFII